MTRKLAVMDATALALCRDNNMKIIVFSIMGRGNLQRVVAGEPVGTIVEEGDSDQ